MLLSKLPIRRGASLAERAERIRRLHQVRWMLAELELSSPMVREPLARRS
jgi:hypothetical protein